MSSTEKYICHVCGTLFSAKFNLNKHTKWKHGTNIDNNSSIKCGESECDFMCIRLNEFKSHMNIKHGFEQEMEELSFTNIEGK